MSHSKVQGWELMVVARATAICKAMHNLGHVMMAETVVLGLSRWICPVISLSLKFGSGSVCGLSHWHTFGNLGAHGEMV